jgi:hypothetical protein
VYSWLVFIHLVGLIVFSAAHGVSILAAFRARSEPDPRLVLAHLAGSKVAVLGAYVGLLLLLAGGLGAAWSAGLLLAPWVVASYGVLLAVLVVMWVVATPYYIRLRGLAGDGDAPPDPAALAVALQSRRPELLASVGGLGLLVLTWLMVFKPG